MEKETVTTITRRSSSYTTHYANGAIFHHATKEDDSVIIVDFLFRSEVDGEPYKREINDDGSRTALPHATMSEEVVLAGIAVEKQDLLRIASLIQELFGEKGESSPTGPAGTQGEPGEPEVEDEDENNQSSV